MMRAQLKMLVMTAVVWSVGAAMVPARASAQSELDATQAQEFMGTWMVAFETDDGEFLVELAVRDTDGKVAASVTTLPLGTQEVTDIARSEDTLTFQVDADAQGQLIPILVRLTPNGEDLSVFLDIGMGMLALEGVGKRMAS